MLFRIVVPFSHLFFFRCLGEAALLDYGLSRMGFHLKCLLHWHGVHKIGMIFIVLKVSTGTFTVTSHQTCRA